MTEKNKEKEIINNSENIASGSSLLANYRKGKNKETAIIEQQFIYKKLENKYNELETKEIKEAGGFYSYSFFNFKKEKDEKIIETMMGGLAGGNFAVKKGERRAMRRISEILPDFIFEETLLFRQETLNNLGEIEKMLKGFKDMLTDKEKEIEEWKLKYDLLKEEIRKIQEGAGEDTKLILSVEGIELDQLKKIYFEVKEKLKKAEAGTVLAEAKKRELVDEIAKKDREIKRWETSLKSEVEENKELRQKNLNLIKEKKNSEDKLLLQIITSKEQLTKKEQELKREKIQKRLGNLFAAASFVNRKFLPLPKKWENIVDIGINTAQGWQIISDLPNSTYEIIIGTGGVIVFLGVRNLYYRIVNRKEINKIQELQSELQEIRSKYLILQGERQETGKNFSSNSENQKKKKELE